MDSKSMGQITLKLIQSAWSRCLQAAEALYRFGVAGIKWCYQKRLIRTHQLNAPVVSVGNLTWGGTGKTPLILHLAQRLNDSSHRVAVLTRGYGQDEAKLLESRLDPIPVLVGPDRVNTGQRAIDELGANLLLLDDGFQQWRLKKDVEILTIDASFLFGNEHMIPRGTLREPMDEAARADFIVVKTGQANQTDLKKVEKKIRKLNPEAPIYWAHTTPERLWVWPSGQKKIPLAKLKSRRVCTLSGIAHPESFEATVKALGAHQVLKHRARDHHAYTAGEMIKLFTRCQRHRVNTVVTTAKDSVRIPKLFQETVQGDLKGIEFWVLDIGLKFEPNESQLLHRIRSLSAR